MLGRTAGDQSTAELEAARARVSELEAALASNGDRDPATGLLTLRRFRVMLDIEAGRARRNGRALAVALLDIDGFRALNGHHGLDAGDVVLRVVAQALERYTRGHDTACRSSGDEFALLMPETDLTEAAATLERMVADLAEARVDAIDGISVSVGVAAMRRDQTASAVLASASRAVDRARSDGGTRVAVGEGPPPEVRSEQRNAVDASPQRCSSGIATPASTRGRCSSSSTPSRASWISPIRRSSGRAPRRCCTTWARSRPPTTFSTSPRGWTTASW